MCGIAGFMVSPADRGRLDTRAMTASLAYDMMSRGKDATGVATVDFKGRWKVRKKDVAADVFLAGKQGIGTNCQSALIHTRAATQGRPENPLNNHPIVHGSIVGIHNGIVYNDDDLFKHFGWERNAQVDSEAIFAAINHLELDEALKNIDAGWAVAWFDADNDPRKLWLARGFSSPLYYALTVSGSIVFASTEKAVEEAFEWGGVNGKANVIKAPEGFLAHTDPDNGGIIVLPEFDGSGKDAIGARSWRRTNGYVHGGMYGYDWEDEAWRGASARFTTPSLPIAGNTTRTPQAYERIWISGDKKNPKVGDRRKYCTASGEWFIEVCISSSGIEGAPGTWSLLLNGGDRTVSGMQVEPIEVTHTPDKRPVEMVDPFDDDDVLDTIEEIEALRSGGDDDDEFKYGFAQEGDLIAIRKAMFDGGEGVLVGKVIGIDEQSKELMVDFRAARIAHDAYYEVIGQFAPTSD